MVYIILSLPVRGQSLRKSNCLRNGCLVCTYMATPAAHGNRKLSTVMVQRYLMGDTVLGNTAHDGRVAVSLPAKLILAQPGGYLPPANIADGLRTGQVCLCDAYRQLNQQVRPKQTLCLYVKSRSLLGKRLSTLYVFMPC